MASSDLINSVIAAHGGQEAYNEIETFTVKFQFTGATLGLKGRPGVLYPTATIYTREQKVVYRGMGGGADEEWIFTTARVWKQKQSATDSAPVVLESRDDPRAAFAGHVLETAWDDLHFVYFSGYALWQYFNFPFLLRSRDDVAARELEPVTVNNSDADDQATTKWRVLEATFPDQTVLATHAQTQKYYFDEGFVLRRHDYAPDVLGGAPAAHYTFDEVKAGGVLIPSFRRVVAINPATGLPLLRGPIPTLIHLVFTSITVQKRGAESAEGDIWALTEAPRV